MSSLSCIHRGQSLAVEISPGDGDVELKPAGSAGIASEADVRM